MNNKIILTACLSIVMLSCSTTPEKSDEVALQEEVIIKNDYPTRDRVQFVLNCVAKHGGLNFINQYACGCKIDKIAEKLTFSEFEGAKTFSYLKKVPGENGGVFRDPKHSKDLRTRLKEADQYAESQCFVR